MQSHSQSSEALSSLHGILAVGTKCNRDECCSAMHVKDSPLLWQQSYQCASSIDGWARRWLSNPWLRRTAKKRQNIHLPYQSHLSPPTLARDVNPHRAHGRWEDWCTECVSEIVCKAVSEFNRAIELWLLPTAETSQNDWWRHAVIWQIKNERANGWLCKHGQGDVRFLDRRWVMRLSHCLAVYAQACIHGYAYTHKKTKCASVIITHTISN